MNTQTATEEYTLAMRQGQREYRERTSSGRHPYPLVLDEILTEPHGAIVDAGTYEIPTDRIIGTKSAGRITAFSAGFLPLLSVDTEFAQKWIRLCEDHLGDVGIRDPIMCYEYLGNFYVQEGNKRVSVLKHFGAPRIPGHVMRVMPAMSEEPRVKAYYEFLEFHRLTRLYSVQYRKPGDYTRLLKVLGKSSDTAWSEQERRTFSAYFQYFREAFEAVNIRQRDILPEEALLLWLQVYPFADLGKLSGAELKKTLIALWEDVVSTSRPESLDVRTKAEEIAKGNLLTRLMTSTPEHLNIAFVHQLDPAVSAWVLGHEDGRKHIEQVYGDRITVRSYFDANSDELAEKKLEQAVEEGAQVVFTTAPLLRRATQKVAVKYPRVRFLNCSVDQPYSSFRSYYGRMYEAKFITGAIAGAMAQNNRIGYIASYPIFGIPASINAFALGAQLTNPRAQIELRWSCCQGTPQADFFTDGIRVVSNREVPTADKMYMEFCNYGTYLLDDRGGLIPLASPLWVWGKFYEYVLRQIFAGAKEEKTNAAPVNYWLGMDSGVIGLKLSDRLPEGLRSLAKLLERDLCTGGSGPFFRKIVAQDGTVKNDGSRNLSTEELLRMNWLCDNVIGEIPTFDKIRPASQATVKELGIYRDKILTEKEGPAGEGFSNIR